MHTGSKVFLQSEHTIDSFCQSVRYHYQVLE